MAKSYSRLASGNWPETVRGPYAHVLEPDFLSFRVLVATHLYEGARNPPSHEHALSRKRTLHHGKSPASPSPTSCRFWILKCT